MPCSLHLVPNDVLPVLNYSKISKGPSSALFSPSSLLFPFPSLYAPLRSFSALLFIPHSIPFFCPLPFPIPYFPFNPATVSGSAVSAENIRQESENNSLIAAATIFIYINYAINQFNLIYRNFIARRVCIARTPRTMPWQDVCMSVCLSVCLSVTLRYSV